MFCRLAPLSSIETEVHSFHSLIRMISSDYPSILNDESYRLISEREQQVVFESNRDIFLTSNTLNVSYSQQTKSIIRNINLLKSHSISPTDFSTFLSSQTTQIPDHLNKKYSDFARIYALFDSFLKDQRLYSPTDFASTLSTNQEFLDLFARVFLFPIFSQLAIFALVYFFD